MENTQSGSGVLVCSTQKKKKSRFLFLSGEKNPNPIDLQQNSFIILHSRTSTQKLFSIYELVGHLFLSSP